MIELQHKVEQLRRSNLLQGSSDALLERLAQQIKTVKVASGDKVIEKGEIGQEMYIVANGRVRVHDNDLVLTYLNTNDLFGEVAALSKEKRTASITAEEDSTLYRLDQEALYEVLTEFPEVAKSIIKMLCEKERNIINDATKGALQVQLFERELEIGRDIQQSFLPECLPVIDGWDIKGYLRPAKEVAGDFYDFFHIEESDTVGIVIGDVCDKGVGAALFMSLFRSLLRYTSMFEQGDSNRSPVEKLQTIIQNTNQYIASTHQRSNMFASVFFGLLDPISGRLVYVNAGHEAPLLISADGSQQQLDPTGPVMGLFADARFTVKSVDIDVGGRLFAYTDGVSEAKNTADKQFGEDKVHDLFVQHQGNCSTLLDMIVTQVDEFAGSRGQYDDMTMIALCRSPN